FDIYANAADIGVNSPVQSGSIIADTNFFRTNLQNGTYYVVEKSAPEGYSKDSTVRTVTISGGDATVTFVNGPTGGAAASASETTTEVASAETSAAATTTAAPVTVTTTVTGGQLPKTGTPWYNALLAGIILILIGAVVWIIKKIYARKT
ncbi:MAG: prealbumin-like fold domain-containing protein, partial [Candidatus Humimicrobiaceae bacterium]